MQRKQPLGSSGVQIRLGHEHGAGIDIGEGEGRAAYSQAWDDSAYFEEGVVLRNLFEPNQ